MYLLNFKSFLVNKCSSVVKNTVNILDKINLSIFLAKVVKTSQEGNNIISQLCYEAPIKMGLDEVCDNYGNSTTINLFALTIEYDNSLRKELLEKYKDFHIIHERFRVT